MKNYKVPAIMVAVIAASFAFVGFECSSAELTSAKLYLQKSEWDKAEVELQKDVTDNPQDGEGWYWLGYVKGQKQEYAGMTDAFRQCLKISDAHKKDIGDITLHYWVQSYNQGTKDLQAGKDTTGLYAKSVTEFNNAILLEPDSLMSYKGLAYAYLNMGNNDSALGPLNILWTREKDEDAAKFLGEIYFENGQKLKTDFQNDNSGKLDTLKNVNSIAEGMSEEEVGATLGQPDQKSAATAEKSKAKKKSGVKEASPDVWTYKTYGLTLTFDNDRLTVKKVDFVYAPQIDSSKYRMAMVQFDSALDILVPASKAYPDDAALTTVLTNSYISADKEEEAADAFKAAAEKNPDNKDFQYDYGVILLKSNNFHGAIDQFQKTLKLDPDYWSAIYNLGLTYVSWAHQVQDSISLIANHDSTSQKAIIAKIEQAIPYLEKYSQYKSDDPSLWDLLGGVYTFMNDKEKAHDAYQKSDSLRQIH